MADPGSMPSHSMPRVSAIMWVLPTIAGVTPMSRRWSPSVGSPTRSGKPFQVTPCERQ